jgi:malonyl CoA-acyl carrier protein transacylase
MTTFIVGVLIGAAFVYLARQPGIKLAWYDWLLLAVAVVFYLLAITNYSGSMEELEPSAAGFLLAAFGVPGLILTAIVAVRVWRSRQLAA